MCYTSADSPKNPHQPCILPFKLDGQLIKDCLIDEKEGRSWCSTKVNEDQEHIVGPNNWGYCSTSCSSTTQTNQKETKTVPSIRGTVFASKDTAWKGKNESTAHWTIFLIQKL